MNITTEFIEEKGRGFIVVEFRKGWKYGAEHSFLDYDLAGNADLAALAIKRFREAGVKVGAVLVLQDRSNIGIEPDLILDFNEPELAPVRQTERRTWAEVEKANRRKELLERQSRRLVAPDIDTTGDMIDPLKAENPLLAFRF